MTTVLKWFHGSMDADKKHTFTLDGAELDSLSVANHLVRVLLCHAATKGWCVLGFRSRLIGIKPLLFMQFEPRTRLV